MKNETEISTKLVGYLDQGIAELKPGTTYRLQLAREQALARLAEPERASEFALSGAGAGSFSCST